MKNNINYNISKKSFYLNALAKEELKNIRKTNSGSDDYLKKLSIDKAKKIIS